MTQRCHRRFETRISWRIGYFFLNYFRVWTRGLGEMFDEKPDFKNLVRLSLWTDWVSLLERREGPGPQLGSPPPTPVFEHLWLLQILPVTDGPWRSVSLLDILKCHHLYPLTQILDLYTLLPCEEIHDLRLDVYLQALAEIRHKGFSFSV